MIKADAQVIVDELVEWILMNRSFGISDILWEVIFKVSNWDECLKLTNIILYRTGVQISEKKHADFPFRYSYRWEATIALDRINQKVYSA